MISIFLNLNILCNFWDVGLLFYRIQNDLIFDARMFCRYETYCIIKDQKISIFSCLKLLVLFVLKWSQVNKLSNNIDHLAWKQSFVVIWNNCTDGSVDNLIWHNKQIPGNPRIDNIEFEPHNHIDYTRQSCFSGST